MIQIVEPRQMVAFRELALRQRRARFLEWLKRQTAGLAGTSASLAMTKLEEAVPEAVEAGIDTEARLFLYAAALLLMPEMDGAQYLLALDVVFSGADERVNIRQLESIRDRIYE